MYNRKIFFSGIIFHLVNPGFPGIKQNKYGHKNVKYEPISNQEQKLNETVKVFYRKYESVIKYEWLRKPQKSTFLPSDFGWDFFCFAGFWFFSTRIWIQIFAIFQIKQIGWRPGL